MNFTQAIVRKPGQSIISGLSASGWDVPDYPTACEQHRCYIQALEACGLSVHILPAEEAWPDSTFVEDVAVLTPHCAIITAPGTESRRGEVAAIAPVLESYYTDIHRISPPGTLEGGDIMQVGSHYYIGVSNRTNQSGAEQLIAILEKYGMSGSMVTVPNLLHLKTGVTHPGC
ncbi:MAG: arginine deiminase family protein [Desulfuromusa sp.]|nr:arginine deiminase family protein [Desulfuromusa sp.]